MDAILQFDSSMLLWIQDSVRSGFLTPVMLEKNFKAAARDSRVIKWFRRGKKEEKE